MARPENPANGSPLMSDDSSEPQDKRNSTSFPWWLVAGAVLGAVDLVSLLSEPHFGGAQLLHGAALAAAVIVALGLWRQWQQRGHAAAHLQEAVDALAEGLSLYDRDDRLVLTNEAYRAHLPHQTETWKLGDAFEDLARRTAYAGDFKVAVGQEEAWIAERLARHRNPGEPWIHEMSNGTWVRLHERRTPSGLLVGLRSDVTELVHAQLELDKARAQAQQDRQLLARAVDALPVGIEIYDAQDRLMLANRRIKDWYPHHDLEKGLGQPFESILRQGLVAGALPVEAQGREEEWLQERLATFGRNERPLLQHWANGLWLMTYERRTPEGFLVSARQDVTELIAKERALQTSQAQLQAIIGTAGVSILTLDPQGRISSANPTTERMLGYAHDELLGQDIALLMDSPTRAVMGDYMQDYLIGGEDREQLGRQRELNVLHKSGRELTVQLSLAEVRSGEERVFVAVLTDITERKRFEIELQHANQQLLRLSTTDSLTDIANRRLLMNRLEDEWRRALRSREPMSLLLADVDFFKLYNDHYGHPAGDACLQTVAGVLRGCAHRPSDLAARYGGEEFVLLLPQTDAAGAQAVAQRVVQGVREVALAHATSPLGPHLTLSIGVVSGHPHTSSSAAQWLAQADLALYQAKAQGRNRVVATTGY